MQRQLVFKVLPFKSRAKIGSKNQILQSSEFKSFSSCYYKDLSMLPIFFHAAMSSTWRYLNTCRTQA